MKSKLMPTIVLGSICLVVAVLLSVLNIFTAPVIAAEENRKVQEAMAEVLPGCNDAVKAEYDEKLIAEGVTEVYKSSLGYVFRMTVTGKSAGMVVMCGIDNEGKITGTKCVSNDETPGYAAPVFERTEKSEESDGVYVGMTEGSFKPDLVGGSTKTSKAYADAIKAALDTYAAIKEVK